MRAQAPAASRPFRCLISSMLVLAVLLACGGGAAAETVPLPPGAATGNSRSTELLATSCPATGGCVAVGGYRDANDIGQPLIESESGGVWSATEAPLSGLGAIDGQLDAVSCASAGSCVAIGTYDTAANAQYALIETESSGVWSGSQLSLSSIGYNDHELDFNAVSCSAAGSCAAVGDYSASSGEQAFVATDSGGSWTVGEVNLSGLGAASDPGAELNAVSCAAAGSCAAVGSYVDSASHDQGLIDTESGGVWTPSKANLSSLPSVATNPNLQLFSVSCPAAGSCTAIGRYIDGSAADGSYQALVLSSSGAAWSNAAKFTLPADASFSNPGHPAQPGLGIDSVSCTSPGNCTAVGSYSAAGNTQTGLELSEVNGSWATGVAVTPPTAVYAPATSEQLNSVVCLAAGQCTILGIYTDGNGFTNAWVVSQKSGADSSASTELTAAETDGEANIACSASDYCAAAGYAFNVSSTPFLLNPPGPVTGQTAAIGGTEGQVSWTASADSGGLPITGYLTTANDTTDAGRGGQTQNVGTSGGPVFSGLTPGDDYTFTITPTSVLGDGIPATTPSVSVPWTRAQLLASLSGLLAPMGKQSALRALRKSHAYTFIYHPIEAGKLAIRWYHISGHGKHRRKRLVGSGSATVSGSAALSVKVKLNTLGRRLVKEDRRLRLTAEVTLLTATSTAITRTHTFTLR